MVYDRPENSPKNDFGEGGCSFYDQIFNEMSVFTAWFFLLHREHINIYRDIILRCPSAHFLTHHYVSLCFIQPIVLATIGWLAILTPDGCNFARVEGPIVADITTNPEMPFLEVGLARYREAFLINDTWTIDYNNQCKDYNVDIVTIGGVWRFSRITAFLALVFGGAGVLLIWFSSCFIFSKKAWKWVGCELLTATLFQLLTFSWLANGMCSGNNGEDKCSISYGAKAAIVTCVVWFVAGICVLFRYPSPKLLSNQTTSATSSSVEMPVIT
jgi:hypothetical protein